MSLGVLTTSLISTPVTIGSTHLYFGPVLPLPTCTLAPFCLYPHVLWPRSASTHLYFGPVLPLPTCTLALFCLYPPVLWPRSASTHMYFGPVLPLPTCTLARSASTRLYFGPVLPLPTCTLVPFSASRRSHHSSSSESELRQLSSSPSVARSSRESHMSTSPQSDSPLYSRGNRIPQPMISPTKQTLFKRRNGSILIIL